MLSTHTHTPNTTHSSQGISTSPVVPLAASPALCCFFSSFARGAQHSEKQEPKSRGEVLTRNPHTTPPADPRGPPGWLIFFFCILVASSTSSSTRPTSRNVTLDTLVRARARDHLFSRRTRRTAVTTGWCYVHGMPAFDRLASSGISAGSGKKAHRQQQVCGALSYRTSCPSPGGCKCRVHIQTHRSCLGGVHRDT